MQDRFTTYLGLSHVFILRRARRVAVALRVNFPSSSRVLRGLEGFGRSREFLMLSGSFSSSRFLSGAGGGAVLFRREVEGAQSSRGPTSSPSQAPGIPWLWPISCYRSPASMCCVERKGLTSSRACTMSLNSFCFASRSQTSKLQPPYYLW